MKTKTKYTLTELENMPTITQGQFSNMKYDDGETKILLSRCTIEDGEPYNNKVTVEKLINGNWTITETYQAK